MSTAALHAGQILEAWSLARPGGFEAELQNALALCESGGAVSEMENEHQAVLQSVVRRFQQISLRQTADAPKQWETGFFLLRHLRSRAAELSR